jgi:DNA polymerase-3 subunit delta
MTASPPIVYLLVGEDEFGISQYLSALESRLGDAGTALMNLTRLDGRSFNLDELLPIAGAAPFLAKRRLVILTHPTARVEGEAAQEKFRQRLSKIPPTTALALVEYKTLTSFKQRKQGKLHWLERWALDHKEIALFNEYPLPDRAGMHRWIQEQARLYGGQITPEAAWQLEELVGVQKRLADQEIQKLLAYTNYQRPVEREDVQKLVADAGQSDIFVLVDAVGNGDRQHALAMLRRLLEQQEPGGIFGMLVRQFRMLLLSREILNQGGGSQQVVEQFKIPPFAANKVLAQARQFSMSGLEAAYHRLLEADERVKSGEMPADLSLEVLVVELTGDAPLTPIQK